MIRGLKKISGETKSLKGAYSPIYLQLFYDRKKKEVFTILHCDLGHSWQTAYDDTDIINICNLCKPCTMKEIENIVNERLLEIDSFIIKD